MATQLLEISEMVSPEEDALYGKDTGFLEMVRDRAGRAIGHRIISDAAVYRRIDPSKNDPFGAVKHRWIVGVERDMDAVECLEKQIDAARREGMRMAAEIVRGVSEFYDRARAPVDGYCSSVIRSALLDAAKKIDEEAK